jgi:hypothetical protein
MKRLTMFVAAVLLAACAKEYAYIPPTDADGKACVAQCQTREASCRRDQDRRAAAAQDTCEAEAARRQDRCEVEAPIEYAACLKFARNEEERKACVLEDCSQPSCQQAGNYGLCGSDYRTCFQSCGGKIEILE